MGNPATVSDLTGITGAITGIIGAATGVVSLFVSLAAYRTSREAHRLQREAHRIQEESTKIHLTITLGHAEGSDDHPVFVNGGVKLSPALVRVFNNSTFDVTISEVGIRVNQPHLTNVVGHITTTGVTLPQRIPSKSACFVYVTGNEWEMATRDIVAVYAVTDAGTEFLMDTGLLSSVRVWYEAFLTSQKKAKRVVGGHS